MKWPTILCSISYSGVIGTIDSQGTKNGILYVTILHGAGAFIYLISLGIMMLCMTTACMLIYRKNNKFMKKWSLVIKILVVAYPTIYLFLYMPGIILWENYYTHLPRSR